MNKKEYKSEPVVSENSSEIRMSLSTGISGLLSRISENTRMLLQPKRPEQEILLPETMSKLKLNKEGNRFAAIGQSGLHILNAENAEIVRTIDPERSKLFNIQWSPDDALIAGEMDYGNSLGTHDIGIWEAASGKKLNIVKGRDHMGFPRESFMDYCFLDQKHLAVAIGTSRTEVMRGLIAIYNITTGEKMDVIRPAQHDDPFAVSLAMIPIMVKAHGEEPPRPPKERANPLLENIRFSSYSYSTHSYQGNFYFSFHPSTVSPQGKKVAKANMDSGIISIIDTSTNHPMRDVKVLYDRANYEARPNAFSISDAQRLAASFKNEVRVWDTSLISHGHSTTPDQHCDRFKADEHVYSIAFLQNNTLVTMGKDQKMKYWNVK